MLLVVMIGLLAWFANHLVVGLEKDIEKNFNLISGISSRIADVENEKIY